MDYDEAENEPSHNKMEKLKNNCIFLQQKCKNQEN
jgi:hypothetical protein